MADPLDAIHWRDELLQVLYWFRGEGLGESVAPQDLTVFLGAEAAVVRDQIERLVAEGYVEFAAGEPDRFRLTDLGVREGGRRFADEFADLTGQAHGECSNPNCACRTLGPEACVSRLAHLQ